MSGPVTVYRMHPEPGALHKIGRRREIILIFLLCLTLLVIAGGGIWYLFGQPQRKVVAAEAPNHPDRVQPVQSVLQRDELARHFFRGSRSGNTQELLISTARTSSFFLC